MRTAFSFFLRLFLCFVAARFLLQAMGGVNSFCHLLPTPIPPPQETAGQGNGQCQELRKGHLPEGGAPNFWGSVKFHPKAQRSG